MEYVRNLHNNYVRVALEKKPEEKRYQYCILSRGGIKNLLSCSLRYIDGTAYLYYDITSKQNIVQLYQKDNITRKWLLDFMDCYQHMQQELGRFLLQEDNIIWEPKHIFQGIENNIFSFLYIPYYEGENSFLNLLSFFVERIDYEDEALVECVYKMYEQTEKNGQVYLQEQIFKDARTLEKANSKKKAVSDTEIEHRSLWSREEAERPRVGEFECSDNSFKADREDCKEIGNQKMIRKESVNKGTTNKGIVNKETVSKGTVNTETINQATGNKATINKESRSRRLFGLFEGRRNKSSYEKEQRNRYHMEMEQVINGYAVAEYPEYEETYGRTAFIAQPPERNEHVHRLYYADGRKAAGLDMPNLLIGKYKDKVDLYLEDESVSRMHARILRDDKAYYVEDENSTNGTFCNQVRLQPYERRKLEPGDELMIGKQILFFR